MCLSSENFLDRTAPYRLPASTNRLNTQFCYKTIATQFLQSQLALQILRRVLVYWIKIKISWSNLPFGADSFLLLRCNTVCLILKNIEKEK